MFDLKFGLLAKNDVGCNAPDLKRRLGVKFPECMFFSRTPVCAHVAVAHLLSNLKNRGWVPKPADTEVTGRVFYCFQKFQKNWSNFEFLALKTDSSQDLVAYRQKIVPKDALAATF